MSSTCSELATSTYKLLNCAKEDITMVARFVQTAMSEIAHYKECLGLSPMASFEETINRIEQLRNQAAKTN